MIVGAGLMSGTSLDGTDVAIIGIQQTQGRPAFELLAFETVPYEERLRNALLEILPPNSGSVEAVARLHRKLGQTYADAVEQVAAGRVLDFAAMHGQTVYHDGEGAVTLQIGSPYFIRDRAGVSVVHDFRSADCALDGQGAPLVPFVDAMLLSSEDEDRVAVNLGGIANFTHLPRGGGAAAALAFDSGPANILIDTFVFSRTQGEHRFDADGRFAMRGTVDERALAVLANDPYFTKKPPKSTGREYFGDHFLDVHATALNALSIEDGAATLTALTSLTVAEAIRSVAPLGARVLLSGGGARNPAVISGLRKRLEGYSVESTDAMNLPVDAKEAIAFAMLGLETLRGRPANLPRVTGARSPAVLGSIVPFALDALLHKIAQA